MGTCYWKGANCCGIKSKEHIIPDSLGGKGVYSYDILCENCNNELGETIDSKLHKQLGHIADVIDINRDRKKRGIIIKGKTEDGKDYFVGEKMSGLFEIREVLPNGEHLNRVFNSEKEAREYARKRHKQLNKNLTTEEINTLVSKIKFIQGEKEKIWITNNISDTVGQEVIGGAGFHKGVAKCIINFFLSSGGEETHISKAIDLLKGGNDPSYKLINFYYPKKRIYQPNSDEISHILHIYACPDDKIAYGYAEMFNAHNCLMILSDNYDGKPLNSTRFFKLKGQPNEGEIKIELSKQDLLNFPFQKRNDQDLHTIYSQELKNKIENNQD